MSFKKQRRHVPAALKALCMAHTRLSPSPKSSQSPNSSSLTPRYSQRPGDTGYDVATSTCGNGRTTPHHRKKGRPVRKIIRTWLFRPSQWPASFL